MEIDPFGNCIVEDYGQVMKDFGISKMPQGSMPGNDVLHRRNIVFAQRGLNTIMEAYEKKRPFAVMTGIKPSNRYHLGSKLVAEQLKYFQGLGAKLFYCVADLECLVTNKIPLEEQHNIAVDNVADLLALGIDPKNAYFYKQSQQETVMNLAFVYANNVTNNMLRAIYGDKDVGSYMAALLQVGDILLPQIPEFGGPKPVVVPVGIDQDSHMRLTRDIAAKHRLVLPASTYNKFMRSLSGESKMSKRDESSMVSLSDDPKEAGKKVMRAFTGGRATVEEQKRDGANPNICPVYDLYLFHLEPDDQKLKQRYDACKGGKLMCGDCKKECAERLAGMLKAHQEKKAKMLTKAEKLIA